MRTLVLASTSKARQALLTRLCVPFTVAAPDVDETPFPNETADILVRRLAEQKARAVQQQFHNAVIIGVDQVGILDNTILGKPHTLDIAMQQLEYVSGKKVTYQIGLCVLDTHNNDCQISVETYSVQYRHLSKSMIENYLFKEDALHCAGSLKIEGLGIALIDKLLDTDLSALIGLPLLRLIGMLEKTGIKII